MKKFVSRIIVKKYKKGLIIIEENKFLIYEDENEKINVDVILIDENIWITQKMMAKLFNTGIDNINVHLKNIYKERELDERGTIEENSIVQKEGTRTVKRKVLIYNLDAIIAVRI